MIRTLPLTLLFPLSFLLISSLTQAGVMYRFQNENGVQELSRSLPPEMAQHGYDIIDDKTMQIIEHVPPALTAEELAKEKALEAELAATQQQKVDAKRQQQDYDRRLLTTYSSEAELIRARDTEIAYREQQISLQQAKLPKAEAQLIQIQNEAAERELSGLTISDNMQKRLQAAHEEVSSCKQAIRQYQQEIEALSQAYQNDLTRFQQLRPSR